MTLLNFPMTTRRPAAVLESLLLAAILLLASAAHAQPTGSEEPGDEESAPDAAQTETAAETPSEAAAPDEGREAVERGERRGRGGFERGGLPRRDDRFSRGDNAGGDDAADGGGAGGNAGRMVSMSFRDADMQQIAMFLMREIKKPVIVDDQVRETRLTILSPDRMPLIDAFELIGNALRQKGVIIVESPKQVELLPIDAARRVNREVVGPDASVADLPDRSRIVDKVFSVEHYDVMKLKDMLLPLLPDYAFLVADPNVNKLVVTAAGADLLHIEQLVERIDIPLSNDTVQRIFHIHQGDASEIVILIRTILSGTLGITSMDVFTSPAGNAQQQRGNARGNARNRGRNTRGSEPPGVGSVFVQRSEAPIMLYADLSRNWIIAAASPAVMEQVERWITELDVPKDRSEPYELFDIAHADVNELATQVNEAVAAMPDLDIQSSVKVIPFVKSRQLLVYGSQRGRALVRSLLEQLDVQSAEYQLIKEIMLEYDTADNVKTKVEQLFGTAPQAVSFGRVRFNVPAASTDLTVTADAQRNSITIRTDPARMERIQAIINEQWDTPLDYEDAQPKVYALKYTDPVLVTTLLENMFSRSSSSTSFDWRTRTATSSSNTPVGRLFGQFSFVAMENSNKLIVSTKNRINYKVIDELIEEIDQPQDAGVPIIIELKHANAEDVAEQLNAMFAEPGTPSAITRNERGLSDAIRQTSTTSSRSTEGSGSQSAAGRQGANQGETRADQMAFWWSQSRISTTEQPVSNLIGKPRIVPVNRRNAVMVMAPRAHIEPFRDLIAQLDQPGSQVVIHAIISEIQHADETTLGVRLASDPGIFNDSRLADQSIGGGVSGAVSEPIFRGDGVLNANVNLNFLIQLLMKNLNLKVLNEPRVYTADNEEAHFFDGQDVPIIVSDFTGGNNSQGNITRSFDYQAVGTRLHVRPHITQEGEVNLEINLELSRIVNGSSVFGNFIFDRRETTTNVTVRDGQTIVISGIVQQEDFDEVRKLPLLGDLPLVGGLFRSTDRAQRNREIIAFVTPHIVSTSNGAEADEITERNRAWLQRMRGAIQGPEPDEDSRLITTPDERDRRRADPAAVNGPVAVPAE